MRAQKISMTILALLLTLLMSHELPAQSSEPQLPDPGSPHATRQQQEQLGQQAMGEVYKQMPVLPDSSPVTRYVQQLGRKLETTIPQQRSWPYQFHVVQQKEINAFALPGGPIFINIGTIQSAENEAQLAGVMAHEMSHIYMQHTAKSMPKQEMTQVFAGILGAVLPGSTAGNLARLGIQVGAGSVLLKYSRKDEAQADAVGAIIAYKAGYNPRALAEFFKKLEQQGGAGGPQFLSDHPNPGNREQAIADEIRNWPPRNYVNNSESFVAAKQESGQIKAYTAQEIAAGAKQGLWLEQNRRNGAVPGNVPASSNRNSESSPGTATLQDVSFGQVKPSGTFIQYRQSDFSFSYPNNWQVNQGNGSVTIAPQAGVSSGAVAYGVIAGEATNQNARGLDQATDNLIQNLQQSNPGLRASGDVSRTEINGMDARSVYLAGNSPIQRNGQPLAERDWLVTVARGQGSLIYLVFISPEPDFSQLKPTFQRILESLQLQ